jgi:hypothetical protein
MILSTMVFTLFLVVSALDALKKGNEKINAAAREAIRLLDRSLSWKASSLRIQHTHEQLARWQDAQPFLLPETSTNQLDLFNKLDTDITLDYTQLALPTTSTRSVESVPRRLRSLIGGCLWQLQQAGLQPHSSEQVRSLLTARIILVTDDAELIEYAGWFGIRAVLPEHWPTATADAHE